MLSSFVVGILWGVMVGPAFEHSSGMTVVLMRLAIVSSVVSLTLKMRFRRIGKWLYVSDRLAICLACLSGILWGFSHSPRAIDSGPIKGVVIYARGCGDQNTDLLVQSNGMIFTARGPALTGDLVRPAAGGIALKRGLITMDSPVADTGQFCGFVAKVRTHALGLLARYPDDVRIWMSAFIFGEQEQLGRSIVNDFRDIGLLHALVLSGGHLSLLMGVMQTTLRAPIHGAYIFKLVRMAVWVRVWVMSRLMAFLSLGFFCFLVGMSQSIQRALLSIAVMIVVETCGFPVKRSSQILSVVAVQACFFPANFLSLSMLLSWCGVLILKAFYRSTFRKSWFEILLQAFLIQLVFMGMSLLFFGSVGILTVPANLLAMGAFAVVLPLDCFALFLQLAALDQWVIWMNRIILKSISWLAMMQDHLPWSIVTIPKYLGRETIVGHVLIALFILGLYTVAVVAAPANRKALGSLP